MHDGSFIVVVMSWFLNPRFGFKPPWLSVIMKILMYVAWKIWGWCTFQPFSAGLLSRQTLGSGDSGRTGSTCGSGKCSSKGQTCLPTFDPSWWAQHVPADVQEILLEDARVREDMDDFNRWNYISQEPMVIPNSAVAQPLFDVEALSRFRRGSEEFWGVWCHHHNASMEESPNISFGEIYTQSFRDVDAENY